MKEYLLAADEKTKRSELKKIELIRRFNNLKKMLSEFSLMDKLIKWDVFKKFVCRVLVIDEGIFNSNKSLWLVVLNRLFCDKHGNVDCYNFYTDIRYFSRQWKKVTSNYSYNFVLEVCRHVEIIGSQINNNDVGHFYKSLCSLWIENLQQEYKKLFERVLLLKLDDEKTLLIENLSWYEEQI